VRKCGEERKAGQGKSERKKGKNKCNRGKGRPIVIRVVLVVFGQCEKACVRTYGPWTHGCKNRRSYARKVCGGIEQD
jgi:hypothetical protein